MSVFICNWIKKARAEGNNMEPRASTGSHLANGVKIVTPEELVFFFLFALLSMKKAQSGDQEWRVSRMEAVVKWFVYSC